MIDFDASYFKNHLPTVISDLESVNSTDFEDHVPSFENKELNFDIELEPFVFPITSESTFEDDLRTSSVLEDLIAFFLTK